MMNAIATMVIDIFMNADIDLGLSFEIIFVIRTRDSIHCQICPHVMPPFILKATKYLSIERISETSIKVRLTKIVSVEKDAMYFSILYTSQTVSEFLTSRDISTLDE